MVLAWVRLSSSSPPPQDVVSKLSELEQLLLNGTTASGHQVTSDEYSDVRSLLRHLEEENAKKFCEFGGLVESLQVSFFEI